MHSALGTTRAEIDAIVKANADPIRHGNWSAIPVTTSAERQSARRLTRDILHRYLRLRIPRLRPTKSQTWGPPQGFLQTNKTASGPKKNSASVAVPGVSTESPALSAKADSEAQFGGRPSEHKPASPPATLESYRVTQDGGVFKVHGSFHNAVKIVELDGERARKLSELSLHLSDLEFAIECLKGINAVPESPAGLREGLWRSAVIHFTKCFGRSNSRSLGLDANLLYKEFDGALEAFDYFMKLADKHFLHDENAYSQCVVGAILNDKKCDQKIAKVITSVVTGQTLNQPNFSNLHSSLSRAIAWVKQQLELLCIEWATALESESCDGLFARPEISYRFPEVDDIDKNRLEVPPGGQQFKFVLQPPP